MLKGVDFSRNKQSTFVKNQSKINGQFTLTGGQNIYQWLQEPHGGWAAVS